MWQCLACNEMIEASLDICWNCGTSRDGIRDSDFKNADEVTPLGTANLPQLESRLLDSGTDTPPPLPKLKCSLRTLLGIVLGCAVVSATVAWYAQLKTSKDFYRSGIAHLKSGEYSEAVSDLTRSLGIIDDEDNQAHLPLIYAARAAAYNNQGDHANCLPDISQAIDLVAQQGSAPSLLPTAGLEYRVFVTQEMVTRWHLLRANTLIGLGEKEKATRDLKFVLQDNPKNQSALHLLAIAEGRKDIDN